MKTLSKLKKTILIVFLITALSTTGFSLSTHSLASTVFPDEILYITDNIKAKDSVSIDSNQKIKKLKLKKIQSGKVAESDISKYKKVIVDYDIASEKNTKSKLEKLLDSGSIIVLRKDDIKKEDIYNYFGFKKDFDYSNGAGNNLKVVAELIAKDSLNNIFSTTISVEAYNDEQKVLNSIGFSLDSNMYEKYILKKQQEELVSFRNSVKASNLQWTPVKTLSWNDSYNVGTVQHSNVLQKNPTNPSGGQYYSILYTPIIVTPASGYSSGRSYFYHTGDGTAKIYDLGPKAANNSASTAYSLSFPNPSVQVTTSFGGKYDWNVSNGINFTNAQWNYTPKDWLLPQFWPNSSQSSFELTTEYYGNSASYKGGFAYTVDIYKINVDSTHSLIGSVNKSGRYVSGT